jgi:Xaa-Pro dipeptidase
MPIRLSDAEFERRRERIEAEMAERDLDALCLFSPTQVFYLTGFSFIATERPIGAIFVPGRSGVTLFIPLLEREHAEEANADDVRTYVEYPDRVHPMEAFADLLAEQSVAKGRIAVDGDGYGGGYGYVGPRLSEIVDGAVVASKDLIEQMMWVKSAEEIARIRESCKWGDRAHRLLQTYAHVGSVETEVAVRASLEASMEMIGELGPEFRAMRSGAFPARAGFRGQIGARSAVPHSMTVNAVLREGDVLVTGAAAEVGGYLSELERTMVLGSPSDEQMRYFELMLELQELAFAEIRPGRLCADVDRPVRAFYGENGIEETWRHHTGHGIGYGMHESPFFDIGDETPIEPGMVLTVEPGIYVPGFAGFRHSDTVLVTETGIEILTTYPRDLESLTLPT